MHETRQNIYTTLKIRRYRNGRPLILGLAIGCLAVSVSTLTHCAKKRTRFATGIPVTVGRVAARPAPLSLMAVGTVEPIETVSVKSQVGGIVTRIFFTEGQDVRAGQPLFQIDPRPYRAALDAAKAQRNKDSIQTANARVQADRYASLVKKGYATQEQYDAARTQAEVYRSTVDVDQAAVEQAELNLDYASIRAPISGRTGSLFVKKGNVVRADDATMVVINQLRPIRVAFAVPEDQLPSVQRYAAGKKLKVRAKPSRSGDGPEVQGRLTFIDNAVDANTGTVLLKAEFANEEGRLWPGQFVDTELILTVESNALTMPSAAVVTGQDGTFAFVVGPDKKVEKRSVKINRTLDGTAVIDEGVKEGDTVVTDGQMRLSPGAVVEIKPGVSKPEGLR